MSRSAVKLQIKELKEIIAEKSKPTIDQAQIDEIKAKIAEAGARAEQASNPINYTHFIFCWSNFTTW